MSNDKTTMGRAATIAQRAYFDTKGMGIEPHLVFTESEFKTFVRAMTAEQRQLCAEAARNAVAHPFAEAELAGDAVEACEAPTIL